MAKVTKAVFPVAGLGTRFLPVTKASPKEMLPVVDKPLIQYAVEEAIAAGIKDMIFITGRGKRAIEDHFDKAYELEAELQAHGKITMLKEVRGLVEEDATYAFVRQREALGLGHAVLCARQLIGDEPFAVILADDLIDAEVPVLKQMTEVHAKRGGSVLAVQNVDRADTASYGIVSAKSVGERVSKLSAIVEKPKPEDAPSTLGVVGRYVLSPRIFHYLEKLRPGAGREIQLTDAIGRLLRDESVYAYEFEGHRYDCGSKLGYLKATVAFALKHSEVGPGFRTYLRGVDVASSNRAEAQRLLDEADLLISPEEAQAAVARMARDIEAKLAESFPVILSVMGGAAVFTGQLLPQLRFPLEFGAIEVTRYNNDTQGRDISWRLPPRDNVRGRTVLVVDDILDEGITLAAIRAKLLQMGATEVYAAVFADKDIGREKPAHADFIGVTVPNRYVFGFGMDAYGLWRNLPAIYALKK